MCQACVDDESQSKGRKLLKQRIPPFPRQLPGACILSVVRDVRGNGHLLQSKN